MIIQAMLFFGIGSITTWLLFSWRFDRDDTILCKKIIQLEEENRKLVSINEIWRQQLASAVSGLMEIKEKENDS